MMASIIATKLVGLSVEKSFEQKETERTKRDQEAELPIPARRDSAVPRIENKWVEHF